MINLRTISIYLALALSQAVGTVVTTANADDSPAEGCVKVAFGDYCLGGKAKGVDGSSQPYPIDVTVDADGRIRAVTQRRSGSDWLSYLALSRQLGALYGRSDDQSTLPRYATARSSRERAIRGGDGEARTVFSADGFEVVLALVKPLTLTLSYRLAQDNPQDAPL